MKMKYLLTSLLMAMLMCCAPLCATAGQGGGFTGPAPDPITVEQAKKLPDDSNVTLRGHIVKNLGGENYLFKDSSGEITLEIDAECWRGQQVGPEDLVEIRGELEKEFSGIEIDVDEVKKL
ncbi:NirD/YgiW/YdeI family stress tolerance protein [Desulfovibrio sp. OttesenSCG-928-C06]|nr:NirD/YgiW/YdeI family stress tolerance protein [Desulfovibrio sp. OttesenSCG-928-C06]